MRSQIDDASFLVLAEVCREILNKPWSTSVLMVLWYWFMQWLFAVRQHTITWAMFTQICVTTLMGYCKKDVAQVF